MLAWLLFAAFYFFGAIASATEIEVAEGSGPRLLGAAVRVIPDPGARLRADDVLAGRHDAAALGIQRAPPNLGYPRFRYWAVLDFQNTGVRPIQRLLVLWRGSPHGQYAYWRNADAAGATDGRIQSSAVNDIESRHSVLRLRLPASGSLRVAVRFDTSTALSLDYRLLSERQLARIDRIDYWFFGLLTGVCCAIAIYVCALFFAMRERLYLCFAGFALFNIVYQLHVEGYAYLLWPHEQRGFGNLVGTYAGTLMCLLVMQFVRDYMLLAKTLPNVDRRLMRPFMWLLVPVFPLFPLSPWMANTNAAIGVVIVTFISASVVLYGSWRSRPVWSFVVGMTLFFVCGLMFMLRRAAVLPDSQVIAVLLQLGSAITMIAFAIAVMERVRRIVAENREAQRRYATRLELEVSERTAQLSQAKESAEQALERLQAAQQQLVQSEKMASLGQLVAGVAHEVNTPLGVALTASSFLGVRAHTVTGEFDAGRLRKSELRGFLGEAEESTEMIERNLNRAAHLITSFKKVSVDRTSDGRRKFRLDDTIEDLVESLALTWKRRPITLTLDCPENLELDSFPGALGQVLTNLIQNTLLHAFEAEQPGTIAIRVRELDASAIELQFRDDGKGVGVAELGKIFEPFYTTKRNQGGTGLGLHVTWNLVSQKLGGSVSAVSAPGEGLAFTMRLPRIAPEGGSPATAT